MTNSTLKQLDKLLAKARAKHRGLPFYKLNDDQRHRYNQWVNSQSADYEAYLAGTLPEQEAMPFDVAKVLGLDKGPTTIPADATEQDASQIYQEYLDNAL